MVRKYRHYKDEKKARLYAPLKNAETGLRHKDLSKLSKLDYFTFNCYLDHFLKEREIYMDTVSRTYKLTEKGREELHRLDRMVRIQKIVGEPSTVVYYDGLVDSLNEIEQDSIIQYFDMLGPLSLPEQMPLPASIDTGIYASKEVGMFLQLAEDWTRMLGQMKPGAVVDKKVRKMIRTEVVGPFAKALLWDAIMERMWALINWHKHYEVDKKVEKPPTFNLDYLLGFNLAIIMEYEGKKLIDPKNYREAIEKRKAAKRLVGAILLRIGSGVQEGVDEASTYDVVDFFERGELLSHDDAEKLRSAFRKLGYRKVTLRRQRSKGRIWLSSDGGGSSRDGTSQEGRMIVLEVACRYLAEGGVLQMPTGVNAESLARIAVYKDQNDIEKLMSARFAIHS